MDGECCFQPFNNALLVVGFASAIGVLILLVIMENPEANLERRLGCFNSYALTEYLKQLYERKKSFGVLEISFGNTDILEEYGMDADEVLKKILQISKHHDEILAFKNINLGLIIISEREEKLETVGEAIYGGCSDVAYGDRFLDSRIYDTLIVSVNDNKMLECKRLLRSCGVKEFLYDTKVMTKIE